MIIEDVYEPLALFRDEFREKFHENAQKFFADLTEKSGIDTEANAATVQKIHAIEQNLEAAKSRRTRWGVGIGLAIAAAILLIVLASNQFISIRETQADASAAPAGGLLAVAFAGLAGLALLFFKVLHPGYKNANAAVAEQEVMLFNEKNVALEQMAELNALFDWDAAAKIIEQTVPRIQFDPYFTEARLNDLVSSFGWDNAFNDGKSVICSQSGEINGNPFVIGQLLEMNWGTKTYTGTRTVSWTEVVRDSKGKAQIVTRYQTLVGTVHKPIPEYSEEKLLIYGNDAAPKLTFSRAPSPLSGPKEGFWAKRKLNREIKRLEKFSRNLNDDSNYTIMGNREFEALFHAVDRNDEVEFRLLFTPLAQKQMLALLNDNEVGYGDDFHFTKINKINVVHARHLDSADINTDPSKFTDFDIANCKARFLAFCDEYFKTMYFALAPLLTIPLYQQTRTHENIYRDTVGKPSTFWEHESIANFIGENHFKHPQSVTRNILKTSLVNRRNEVSTISVQASGYRTVERVDTVRVMARNGRFYDVSVPWDEYLPVQRTTNINISERDDMTRRKFKDAIQSSEEWANFFRSWNSNSRQAAFRRSIISF